jgi:hypothetical protein
VIDQDRGQIIPTSFQSLLRDLAAGLAPFDHIGIWIRMQEYLVRAFNSRFRGPINGLIDWNLERPKTVVVEKEQGRNPDLPVGNRHDCIGVLRR